MKKIKVLFVCTHNSARSQMAEGIVNTFHSDLLTAYSTGRNPTVVNPLSVVVCSEIGADISGNYSKGFDELAGIDFDYIITVCDNAKEACPSFTGDGKRIHKSFDDPSGFKGSENEKLAHFRKVRDEIRQWIEVGFIKNIQSVPQQESWQ